MTDELYSFRVTKKLTTDSADMNSLSDSEDFEKLSIPCSERSSSDEADVDTSKSGHLFNSADRRLSLSTSPSAHLEVCKPPTVSAASVPSVHTEVHQHTSVKGAEETLSNQLISLATSAEHLIVRMTADFLVHENCVFCCSYL